MPGLVKLAIALVFSFVLHAVAAQFGPNGQEEELVAGGAVVEIASLGSAFENSLKEGSEEEHEDVLEAETADELVKEESQIEEIVEAAEPEQVIENEVVEHKAVEEAKEPAETRPVENVSEQIKTSVEADSQRVVEKSEVSKVNDQAPDNVAPKIIEQENPEPTPVHSASVTPVVPLDELVEHEKPEIAEIPVIQAVEAEEEPVEVASLSPVEPIREVIPEPNPRPRVAEKKIQKKKQKKAEPKKKKKAVEKKPEKQKKNINKKRNQNKAAKKKTRRKSGDKGKSTHTAKRGVKDGLKNAKSSRKGTNKRSSKKAGNSTVTSYGSKVRRRIARNKRYPKSAQRKKIKGKVRVTIVIARNGRVNRVRVARSSGHSILDDAAIQTIKRSGPFPSFPNDMSGATHSFTIPLNYD